VIVIYLASGLLAGPLANASSLAAHAAEGRGALGDWLDSDGGVIRIEQCGTRLCGRIVGLEEIGKGGPEPKDIHGRGLCRMLLMNDLTPAADNVWRGHITDPSSGRRWGADIFRDDEDRLHLQGYVDLPVLSLIKPTTRLWTRYGGRVGDDCREFR